MPQTSPVTDKMPQWPTLTLRFLGHGAVGSVYRSRERFIFKMAHAGAEKRLRDEKEVYDILAAKNIKHVPSCYGLFQHDGSVALVLSYEGTPLRTFDELSLSHLCVYL